MADDHGRKFVQRDLRMISVDRVTPGQDRGDRGVITRVDAGEPAPRHRQQPRLPACDLLRRPRERLPGHRLHSHPVAGSPDRDRVSAVMLLRGTPAAAAVCVMAVAFARGGGGSYMPYAPDITIRRARPARYNAAARTARATVAGCGSPPGRDAASQGHDDTGAYRRHGPDTAAGHPAPQPRLPGIRPTLPN
jgi:hypothetical protein